jgi:site-specific DNA-methyltransferase (adenine-specific)
MNIIYNENCINTLEKMGNQYIDGIITSPPYNKSKNRKDFYYNSGYFDGYEETEYLEHRMCEFYEFSRVLKDRGVICYNISYNSDNPILPILLLNKIHEETDLTLADIITWKKKHSIPFQTSSTKLSRICEQIYIIVKKKHLKDFITNKKISMINNKTKQKFYKNYTNYIEANNNDKIKCNHKATFSQDMVNKLIEIYFPCKSVIYDPFCGIGTTCLSCIQNDCYYIGSELETEFYELSLKRINEIV